MDLQERAQLAQEFAVVSHRVSHRVVAELLHALGYSLQANAKTLEGRRIRIATPSLSISTERCDGV